MTNHNDSAASPANAGTDINAVFRGGGRSVEFLDRINKASIVMLGETGIGPPALATGSQRNPET